MVENCNSNQKNFKKLLKIRRESRKKKHFFLNFIEKNTKTLREKQFFGETLI